MPDIFLSYSRDDQTVARRFAEAFERAGLSVWWDATLNPGEAYDKVTEKALAEAKAVAVLWSRKSVDSRWVRAEATQANSAGTLVPVMIEACKRPIMFELTHTADLSRWNGDPQDKNWLAYLAGVRRFINQPEPAASNVASTSASARRSGRNSRVALAVVSVLGLLLIAGGIQWALTHGGDKSAAGSQTAPAQVSLAVLPFVNLSSDQEQEYFSDGLSEELLNQLAQIQKLRLTARTSSFSFKGKNEDVRVIGQKLGVGNVLEGSVRKDGKNLRITAQLIDARDGSHLWSKTYDRELEGVFAVQEEIAKDVAKALSVRLDVGEVTRAEGGTNSVEAYDKYLQGQAMIKRGLSLGAMRQAAQLYRGALALDPDFSRASVGLYIALFYLRLFPAEAPAAAREMEETAARLEAQTPNAWWTQRIRADQSMAERKWSDAEHAFNAQKSGMVVRIADLGANCGFFNADVGFAAEAARECEKVVRNDPLSLSASVDLQRMLDEAGRDADAQTEYLRSRGLEGDHSESHHHALFRMWRMGIKDPDLIKAQFDLILANEALPMALTRTLARAPDDAVAARAAIRQAFEAPENQDQLRMFVIAMSAAHYGDPDLALAALQRRYLEMKARVVSQLWYPYEGNVRTNPRFKKLLQDMGLVDYFRSSGNWPDYCKPVGATDFECH